jgi:hypothetical protein
MADGLILEFDGFGVEKYEQVNGLLGIDMHSGEGDWPAGMLATPAGPKTAAGWSSRSGPRRPTRRRSCRTGSARPWPRPASRARRPGWSGSRSPPTATPVREGGGCRLGRRVTGLTA